MGVIEAGVAAENRELLQQLTSIGCLELVPVMARPQALESMMESDSLMLADTNHAEIGHTVPAKLLSTFALAVPSSP